MFNITCPVTGEHALYQGELGPETTMIDPDTGEEVVLPGEPVPVTLSYRDSIEAQEITCPACGESHRLDAGRGYVQVTELEAKQTPFICPVNRRPALTTKRRGKFSCPACGEQHAVTAGVVEPA
jgi:predicted RNA-binding Zn-ribbon protein involved in translation (DUF1610 family)